MSDTMRAATYERYGDPEVLTITDMPKPKVGPGEIRVRVRAVSVNPVDWKIMAGGLDPMMDAIFPVIPGWDVAGVVEEVGIDTPEFSVGDEVVAYARKDVVHGGTFAELVTVPVRCAARKPSSASWEEAAGLPLAGLTAYQVLTRLGVEKGSTVLVHGASGGVGRMGVQIARDLGARVIGTASEKNHDMLRGLGAEPVTYGDGLADRVKELAPEGVDIVADFVGGVVDVTTAVLAEGSRHGSIADPDVLKAGGQWMWVRPDAEGLAYLSQMVDDGRLSVEVAETFPLEKAADAFSLSKDGHTSGKIVVVVSE